MAIEIKGNRETGGGGGESWGRVPQGSLCSAGYPQVNELIDMLLSPRDIFLLLCLLGKGYHWPQVNTTGVLECPCLEHQGYFEESGGPRGSSRDLPEERP